MITSILLFNLLVVIAFYMLSDSILIVFFKMETSKPYSSLKLVAENENGLEYTNGVQSLVSSDSLDVDFSSFPNRSETLWSKCWHFKTRLEKALFIVVMLLSIIFLIVTIYLSTSLAESENKLPTSCELPQALKQPCVSRSCVKVASDIAFSLDESIDPCQDFYKFSCGGWIKRTPLPMGHARWTTFDTLWKENQAIMKAVLEENSTLNSPTKKKGELLYQSCLDMAAINKQGAQPLVDLIDQIGGWAMLGTWNESNYNFNETLRTLSPYVSFAFVSVWVGTDARNSKANVLQIGDASLTAGSRDYYINKTINGTLLSAYLDFMTQVGVLLGGEKNSTEKQMREILELERELAVIQPPLSELRDSSKNYRKVTVGQLQDITPAIDWPSLVESVFNQVDIKVGLDEPVVVVAMDYMKKVSDVIYKTPPRITHNYLIWNIVTKFLGTLGQSFIDAANKLSKIKYGADYACQERWKQCVGLVDGFVWPILGRLFVERQFSEKSKASAEEMASAIKESFKENLNALKWMDKRTKQKAVEKVNAVVDLVGYSKDIFNTTYIDEEYKELSINKGGSYFNIYVNVTKFSDMYNLKQLREPIDRFRWGISPPTVNAFYSQTKNAIVFPAGILQPPFYSLEAPASYNYGAMGVIVGHELTHGFDDEGRTFDLEGNLKNWWENETSEHFKSKTECMIDQYSQYKLDGAQVNGHLTLGENIADNGGLKFSYQAYQRLKSNMSSSYSDALLPSLNYTNDQLFYISFAQMWCTVATPQYISNQVLTDYHTPGQYRVIGTLSNSPQFSDAFQCPKGSPMNPEKKCTVW